MKKKNLSYYLNLNYPIAITRGLDEGKIYFEAGIPDLPGCNVYGKTIEDALKNLEEAKIVWLRASLRRNLSIPEPVIEDEFSGKFILRIAAKLHMKLTINAKNEGLSLNQYIRKTLESKLSLQTILERVEEISQRVEKIDNDVRILPEKITMSHETATFAIVGQASRAHWQELGETAVGLPFHVAKNEGLGEEEKSESKIEHKEA